MSEPGRDGSVTAARLRLPRAGDLPALALAFVAEGAWLSVIAGLLQEFAKREPVLGPAELAALVALGAIAGRIGAARLGRAWPFVAVGLVVVAGVGGVLASAAARDVITGQGIAGLALAAGANPGGLVAGVALLRGTSYAAPGLRVEGLDRLLGAGTVAIVVAAVIGGFVPDPWRARFIADTLFAGVVFAAASILALALRRQALEGRDRGADWQRNPRWVALLVVVVAAIVGAAALSSGFVRPALELLIGLAVLPLLVLGLLFGWTRRGFTLALVLSAITGVVAVVFHLLDDTPPVELPEPGAAGGDPAALPPAIEPSVMAVGGAVVLGLALVAAFLLIAWWARRGDGRPGADLEERFIDRRPAAPRRRGGGWFRNRRQPADGAAAYLALLAEIADREGVRRDPSETPREHAARLRRDRLAGLQLELLAADYTLASFGGIRLSDRENRRAVTRWRSLRRALRPVEPPDEESEALG